MNTHAHIRGRGFTLLEVVVFIVVGGVLAAGLLVAIGSTLRGAPQAGQTDVAAELAQLRMEMILAQRRASGFSTFSDPCTGGTPPAACTAPTGYTVTSSIAGNWNGDTNYKVITVSVTGTFATTATALVASY